MLCCCVAEFVPLNRFRAGLALWRQVRAKRVIFLIGIAIAFVVAAGCRRNKS